MHKNATKRGHIGRTRANHQVYCLHRLRTQTLVNLVMYFCRRKPKEHIINQQDDPGRIVFLFVFRYYWLWFYMLAILISEVRMHHECLMCTIHSTKTEFESTHCSMSWVLSLLPGLAKLYSISYSCLASVAVNTALCACCENTLI